MSRETASEGDVEAIRARGSLGAFTTGVAAAAALTAGIAQLLYTGPGFLRTTGMLVAVAIGAVAAGIWAGDEVGSARARGVVASIALTIAAVYTALWLSFVNARAPGYGGALAVLIILALPAYTVGGTLAALYRDGRMNGATSKGVQSLAGAAAGVILATAFLIPRFDVWGVYIAASTLMLPVIILPHGGVRTMHDTAGMLRGRVALITGVAHEGQLGYAIAKRFVEEGARVIVSGFPDDPRALAQTLGERDAVLAVRADLTADADLAELIRAAESFGRLDILVNVAGGLTVIAPIEDTDAAAFRREMTRNAETMLLLSRAALPMLRAARGSIINFASPAGEHAVAKLGAYSAAKAAVIAITQSLALEEASNGVRVNAIAPGMIDTAQNRASSPDAKFVSREQVAAVVVFLASSEGSGVTGEVVHVGGIMANG